MTTKQDTQHNATLISIPISQEHTQKFGQATILLVLPVYKVFQQ